MSPLQPFPASGLSRDLAHGSLSSGQRAWRRLCLRHPALGKLDRRLRALWDMARLRRSGAFDDAWYVARYPDVAQSGLTPLAHYVRKGAWEGRRPRADFDPLHYLSIHEDVAASGVEPFTHYVLFGQSEGRAAAPGSQILSELAERRRARPEGDAGPEGWYGARPLLQSEHFPHLRPAAGPFVVHLPQGSGAPEGAGGGNDWHMRLGPVDLLQERIATRQPPPHLAPSAASPTFSLVTVFTGDRAGFARSAGWVGALLAEEKRRREVARVHWIVLNDDPACGQDELEAVLPRDVRAVTTLISDGRRRGVSARRNEGAAVARGDFLLFLDAGDALAPDALRILSSYIAAFPLCRCICAGFLELGRDGRPLARQDRLLDASELLSHPAGAGALAAVRKDLIAGLGGFDARFEQAASYELMLRTALQEPILSIPEPLLGRSAGRTAGEGVAGQAIEAVRIAALRALVDDRWPEPPRPEIPHPPIERGLCLVRTQGRRPELLSQALMSIYGQAEPLVAAVIVHGDAETFERVCATAPKKEGAVVFLHAADTSRRRGHPWNVGLDYLEQQRDQYQYLCFLDDDDIYYPHFTQRMVEAFRQTGADVVYALANRRTPGGVSEASHMPLPISCLVAGNFIPTNSYALRTGILVGSGIRVLEDVDYFEDWDFLVSLLATGCRFHLVPEAVGEFLLIGDGNSLSKRDPAHHAWCLSLLLAWGGKVAGHLGMGRFYRDLLDFDFRDGAARHPSPGGHLILAKKQFLRAGGAV
ncbi:glycosyltransferase [Aquabacter sp. CN5-332]|uniref:glycosyltransferase family 2 protein n=1 Tax=Aquabacter sp. CN5-332 TaxID=3156608 RepID=UPI0032B462F4